MKSNRYFSALKYFNIDHYRIVHSFKTALACFIGLILINYYDWPSGNWIPITTMVVMSAQKHFGGAVHKSIMRFLGTLGGILLSVIALLFFDGHPVIIFSAIVISSIIFSYIASSRGDISYAGTLGGVTVLVILTTEHVGMEVAFQRGSYIFIGIVIALLVSRLVFPIHARDRFRYHVAVTLRNISKLYFLAIQLKDSDKNEEEMDHKSAKLNMKIAGDIASQPTLVHEAIVGSREIAANRDSFNGIVRSEQNLNRLVDLMYINLREVLSTVDLKAQLDSVSKLHSVIIDGLVYLADCFEAAKKPKSMVSFDEDLAEIVEAVEKMPKLSDAHQLIAGHSFLFFMEQILKELGNMREIIAKVNGKSKDSVV